MILHADSEAFSSEAIVGSGTATSGVIRATHGQPESVSWVVTQTGTPDVDIEYAYSNDGTTFSAFIAAFGAAGNTSGGKFTNSTGQTNSAFVAWVPAPFYQVKLTNNDGVNTATCSVIVRQIEDV